MGIGAPGALMDQHSETRYPDDLFHLDFSVRRAIPLCDWGCFVRSYLDPDSGHAQRRYMDAEVEAASLSAWLEGGPGGEWSLRLIDS